MRRPNKYGSIYKMPGKRRKPWRVVLTVGWEQRPDGIYTQKRQTLGYYATRAEAVEALAAYHVTPYDISTVPTFAEIYQLWEDEHFKTIAESRRAGYRSAYKKCAALYNRPFRDIKTRDFESVCQQIIDSGLGAGSVQIVIDMFHGMGAYALRKDIVPRDVTTAISVAKPEAGKPIHRSLTPDEIAILWDHADDPLVQILLVGIASGTRPSELIQLKSENYHGFYVVGGLKTDAGKNRIIPIHPEVARFLHPDQEYLLQSPGCNYHKYRLACYKLCGRIGINDFKPHDTRHTFSTLWARQQLNPIIGKKILGHAITDITESVYIHRTAEDLYRELVKLNLHPKSAEILKISS